MLVKTNTIPSPVWASGTISSYPFRWFFPWPHTHADQYFIEYSRWKKDAWQITWAFSLCSFLLSGGVSYELQLPVLPRLSARTPQLRKFTSLFFSSSSLCSTLETQGSMLEQLQGSPHLFPFSQGSLMSSVLKTIFFMYFVWFFCSRQDCKSNPCDSILAGRSHRQEFINMEICQRRLSIRDTSKLVCFSWMGAIVTWIC